MSGRIKITDSFGSEQWSKNQHAFYAEFMDLTSPADENENSSYRIWENKAHIYIAMERDGTVRLEQIEAIEKGKGHGGEAFRMIDQLAKKHHRTRGETAWTDFF